jgi:hypothetical protein
MDPNFIGYLEKDTILDMYDDEKLMKGLGAKPIRGKLFGRTLWSTYTAEKGEKFLEFKEDGTAFGGSFGKWEIKDDILTLYVKDPEGKEEPMTGKIKNNTIRLGPTLWVKK